VKVQLKNRDKRAVLVLAAAVALYALMSWVILPAYDSLGGAQTEAVEKERLLQKYRQVASRKGNYDALLGQVAKLKDQAGARLIRAANPSLAAVELQALVEETARKLNIVLIQRNVPSPAPSAAPLREMTMTLAFEATPQQMVAFLSELRSLPRFVRVVALTVNPLQIAQSATPSTLFSKNIRVGMTLGAWMELPHKELVNEQK
jgi:hypothetical protein